ncbi:hypothetical protein B0I35DRAFT_352491 [Stachybotrys elegans]|uniref:Uncharacterized protein n=1 Tax=Stachybotrys elegans TaxID=80388 RepID=A0A8K0SWP1_9HYPO|nr:hypothetical protein B0I35DRAFT_352491 [Stachybotrys elegans]
MRDDRSPSPFEWNGRRQGQHDMDTFKKFTFGPSSEYLGSLAETLKDDDASGADSNDVEDTSQPKASQALSIYTSHYNGSSELGGSHGATFKVVHEPTGQSQPLFRWLHLHQETMKFDDFWVNISRNVRLSDSETSAVAKLRAEIKRKFVKNRPNPEGAKVGYMEPSYLEVPLRTSKEASAEQDPGAVRWLCMPYFSLGEYSGLLSASDTASFPSQTLLQLQYSRIAKTRDMEQAVRQLGTVKGSECFHVEQLWCLVVGNNLLVTCGNMPAAELRGDTMELISEPARSPALKGNSGRIKVIYENSISWVFTAEECSTWFSFLSHFGSFWPGSIEFMHRDHVVKPERWPKIWCLANGTRGILTLKLVVRNLPDPSTRLTLNSTEQVGTKAQEGTSQRPLHLLNLACGKPSPKTETTANETENVQEKLAAAETFLSEKTSFPFQNAYKTCLSSTRETVRQFLDTKSIDAQQAESDDTSQRHIRESVEYFNLADDLFQLFLPPSFNGPTANKFWGAVDQSIRVRCLASMDKIGTARRSSSTSLRTFLRDLNPEIAAFQSVFSYASDEERKCIKVPQEFVEAWLHIVSAMIHGAKGTTQWFDHFEAIQQLIEKGMEKMFRGMSSTNLLDKVAVLPMETMPLVLLGLLKDRVRKADDISETYSQYLNFLESDIMSKPPSRSFQNMLDLAQQEMAVVRRTLAKQRYLISSIRRFIPTLGPVDLVRRDRVVVYDDPRRRDAHIRSGPEEYGHMSDRFTPSERLDMVRAKANDYMDFSNEFMDDLDSASKLSPTDPGGYKALIFMECALLIEQREFDFRRYTEHADDLKRSVIFKLGITRDRQEDAIYAFTVVTIIFLPLSAVAGIFGMNTSDVRDMQPTQWLYWSVAIPVTLAVIALGLWWMGELGNVFAWMTGRPRDVRASASRYPGMTVTPTSQVYLEPQTEDRIYEVSAPPAVEDDRYTSVTMPSMSRSYQRVYLAPEYRARVRRRDV